MMLQDIWFFLWGLLWAVYFITDGFDLGIGVLLPFLGKDNDQKRVLNGAMGPLWDGNEVWLLTAGGVTFAAFPMVYAVMFSSLYSALMLILFALILRGVSWNFGARVRTPAGVDSGIPACFWEAFFRPSFSARPLPISFEEFLLTKTGFIKGTLFTLLNPYGLLGGILFLLLFLVHGATWLAIKSDGELREKGDQGREKVMAPSLHRGRSLFGVHLCLDRSL